MLPEHSADRCNGHRCGVFAVCALGEDKAGATNARWRQRFTQRELPGLAGSCGSLHSLTSAASRVAASPALLRLLPDGLSLARLDSARRTVYIADSALYRIHFHTRDFPPCIVKVRRVGDVVCAGGRLRRAFRRPHLRKRSFSCALVDTWRVKGTYRASPIAATEGEMRRKSAEFVPSLRAGRQEDRP